MSRRLVTGFAVLCVGMLAACKGEKGDQGPPGPEGVQGAQGDRPLVAANGGIVGDGTPGNPIAVDRQVVPSKGESNRIIEAEGASATGLGVVQTNAKASGGSIRFAAASASAGGVVWRVEKAQVGALATGTTFVSLNAAVTNNVLTSNLATLRCGATRGTPVEVGTAVTMHPNDFPAGGAFKTFEIVCAWLPDDTDQYVEVTDFAIGVTDLSVDFIRVMPRPQAPWDGASGSGQDHAFCVGTTYSYTRYQAATLCKGIGMRLCTLAELSAYAEADYASCCWGWVADLGSNLTTTQGMVAYPMYSSQTTTVIPGGCGGNPGGLRFQNNQPNTNTWAAHCCK
ncbi:MAG TPA: hypothetical protein VIG99_30715 [Myxococcaceae bacterium]|jgi:hypothetical protein